MGVPIRLVKPNEPFPKKRFGQHFLRDKGVIDRIARWIQPLPGDLFVEIGAGDGALSLCLAPGVSRLLAIEVDADCIPHLEKALSGHSSAKVIPADILHMDLEKTVSEYLMSGTRLRFAGNLPYNIATAIIEKLLRVELPIIDMAFMVQLEVAQRITADHGTRQYGYFSVICQHFADVRMGFTVSPACFVPRPQVRSALVSFRLKPKTMAPALELRMDLLAKAAFSYRRKTLENSLARHPVFKPIGQSLLDSAGISGSRRAEDLSVEEYEHLARRFHEMTVG